MAKEDEIWRIYKDVYKGRWIRVSVDGTQRIGILRDAKYDYISLYPCIIAETLELKGDDLELRLEKETPTMISMPIRTIEPISEEFVKKFLEKYPIRWDSNQLSLF